MKNVSLMIVALVLIGLCFSILGCGSSSWNMKSDEEKREHNQRVDFVMDCVKDLDDFYAFPLDGENLDLDVVSVAILNIMYNEYGLRRISYTKDGGTVFTCPDVSKGVQFPSIYFHPFPKPGTTYVCMSGYSKFVKELQMLYEENELVPCK